MRVFVLTDSPSPYQVELFNEIEMQGGCELKVGYLRSRDPQRQWTRPDIRHESIEIDRGIADARAAVRESDLVVFNYYAHSQATELIGERASRGGPWCFWGERPGFRQEPWAALGGRLLRRWKLARLHGSSVPIWGIGKFAVDEYRREFGQGRSYFNLPYFSNLERFGRARSRAGSERVFLFCGSLIERKGVDLIARAFVQLAAELPNVRLKIAGDGELRESLVRVLRRVSDRVEFSGFKDWSELPELYASADVLCVPSRYDGWGLVVPEGLASGLPVIATKRMGAALEFVQTGVNGWLIPAGDETAILSAMRAASSLTNAELGEHSQRASASVKDHTLQNGSQRFLRFARETIGV